MSSRAPLLLVAAIALGFTSAAHARRDPRLDLELAFGVSGSTELRTVVMTSPLLTLSAPISMRQGLVIRWGFTVATGEPTDQTFDSTHVAFGNPLFGLSLVVTEGLVFTPSVTLPVAHRPEAERRRPASGFAFRGGLGLRGARDAWLWVPDQLTIVLPLSWVVWLDPVLIESHAKVGILFPTSSDDSDTDFLLQAQVRFAVHLVAGLWLAAGASGVFTPTDTLDNFQAAAYPELRWVIGPMSHVAVTLTMNIDGPYGPFNEPGHYWGVLISGSMPL